MARAAALLTHKHDREGGRSCFNVITTTVLMSTNIEPGVNEDNVKGKWRGIYKIRTRYLLYDLGRDHRRVTLPIDLYLHFEDIYYLPIRTCRPFSLNPCQLRVCQYLNKTRLFFQCCLYHFPLKLNSSITLYTSRMQFHHFLYYLCIVQSLSVLLVYISITFPTTRIQFHHCLYYSYLVPLFSLLLEYSLITLQTTRIQFHYFIYYSCIAQSLSLLLVYCSIIVSTTCIQFHYFLYRSYIFPSVSLPLVYSSITLDMYNSTVPTVPPLQLKSGRKGPASVQHQANDCHKKVTSLTARSFN